MKKLFQTLLVVSIFFTPIFDADAKVKKLKNLPSIKKILKKENSGLVQLRLQSNETNYKVFLQGYDPETGELINERRFYRFKYSDRGGFEKFLLGNDLKKGTETIDHIFLLPEGTYILRSISYSYRSTFVNQCFRSSMMFEIKKGTVNYLGDFTLSLSSTVHIPGSFQQTSVEPQEAEASFKELYPEINFPFESVGVKPAYYSGKCKSMSRTTIVY